MIKLIVCMGIDGGIGKDNALIYNYKKDMKFFKETTTGHVVVMGKNTFESLGRPLPNRVNVVLTDEEIDCDHIIQFVNQDLSYVLQKLDKQFDEDIFIIGGAYVYNEAIRLKLAEELFITMIYDDKPSDTKIDIDALMKRYEPTGPCLDVIINSEGDILGTIDRWIRR